MKNLFIFIGITVSISISTFVAGQSNYIATSPSSAGPGTFNTVVGISSGTAVTTGNYNVFFGAQSGVSNTEGFGNAYIGYQAGFSSQSARLNTFIGFKSGYSNTTGFGNVFIGEETGYSNISGIGNMFLGQQAGANNKDGSYNLFIGNASGSNTTAGLGNTAVGDGSLLNNQTGIHNVAIGRYAGVANTNDENVFIGFGADVASSGLTNAVAIGARARVNQSNSIVLGNNANVGIGNTAPKNKLEITSATANTSGLRFSNLTNGSNALVSLTINPTTPIAKVLTVDANGDVVLAGLGVSLTSGGREAASLWEAKEGYTLAADQKRVVIGTGVTSVPADYNLFVSKGILTEKVKVAIKGSSEWADYVFAKDYKLLPLEDVGRFVAENKHLPGVPSASEMVQMGNDLHKTDVKLLEKIEELTLYTIQLEKANQAAAQRAINQQQAIQQQQAEITKLKQAQQRLEKVEALLEQLLTKGR